MTKFSISSTSYILKDRILHKIKKVRKLKRNDIAIIIGIPNGWDFQNAISFYTIKGYYQSISVLSVYRKELSNKGTNYSLGVNIPFITSL